MKLSKKLEYINKPSIAFYNGFAFNGVHLKEIQFGIDDYAVVVCGEWTNSKSVHRIKIHHNSNQSFIIIKGYHMNLKDFIKV